MKQQSDHERDYGNLAKNYFCALCLIRNRRQYNFQTFSMENWLQAPLISDSSFLTLSDQSMMSSSSFGQLVYPPSFISQLINRMTSLEQSMMMVTNELAEMRLKKENSTMTCFSDQFQEENKKEIINTFGQSKKFTKHLKCPVIGCRKRYSSRIAMRSHVRRFHHQQFKNNSF